MRGEERWGERRRKAKKRGCEGNKEREEEREEIKEELHLFRISSIPSRTFVPFSWLTEKTYYWLAMLLYLGYKYSALDQTYRLIQHHK